MLWTGKSIKLILMWNQFRIAALRVFKYPWEHLHQTMRLTITRKFLTRVQRPSNATIRSYVNTKNGWRRKITKIIRNPLMNIYTWCVIVLKVYLIRARLELLSHWNIKSVLLENLVAEGTKRSRIDAYNCMSFKNCSISSETIQNIEQFWVWPTT